MQNKITLLMIMVIFTAPVLLANLAYFGDWAEGRKTVNKGSLINPPIPFSELITVDGTIQKETTQVENQRWRIIYYSSGSRCDLVCRNTVEIVKKTHIALGKESSRAEVVALVPDGNDWKKALQSLDIKNKQAIKNVSTNTNTLSEGIYIADPLGFVVLHYSSPQNDETHKYRIFKDILSDLKKLMKYSSVG
ncbi:MAG: hypothetical protein AAGB12_11725 [Pseudomonadota bacterium]